ncbi:uridine kinase [candidate division Kazan bacterium]|uniref:Uridine kinase n=1 Tax=candidate division Kazan bacterium TaxID=2202143 RepID=A0A420ZD52_UNCK3|nr:MAG: uridine kinase [candidate division Kazan bacterium]
MDSINQPFVIGIGGGTGSGKTYIAKQLQKIDPSKIILISHDHYYKDRSDIPLEDRKKINYDEPAAIDGDLFAKQMLALKSGHSIDMPLYDFSTHTRQNTTQKVKPAPVIIIEGILILTDKRIRDLLDLTIFVEADPDIRLARRLERDIGERDRSFEESINQYLISAQPMHDKYVEPGKDEADIIINNNRTIEELEDALETIRARILEVLENSN